MPAKIKKFRLHGVWYHKGQESLPEEVDAVIIEEQITLKEYKDLINDPEIEKVKELDAN